MLFNPNIFKYVKYVLWRSWLVALVAGALGGAGFLFADSQERTFTAETRIFVGSVLTSPDVALYQVDVSIRLAPTYAEFARQNSVLEAVIEDLDLDMSIGRLRNMVSARVIVDTSILSIRVSSNDSQMSADIANSVAENLLLASPSNLNDDEIEQMETISVQMEELDAQIDELRQEIADVNEQLTRASERQNIELVNSLTDQRNLLVTQRGDAESTLSQFRGQFLSLTNRVGRLEIVEDARPPLGSSGFRPRLIGLLGFLAGAGITVGGLLIFFEYADDRLRTESEIKKHLDLPILGTVKRSPILGIRHQKYLDDAQILKMRAAEGYRNVKANLIFSPDYQNVNRMYVISSPNYRAGRSFTAANLAVIAAEAGLRVLLIDGDLRRPRQHKLFGLDNTKGLGPMLSLAPVDLDAFSNVLEENIQPTHYSNLYIMASGMDSDNLAQYVLGMTTLQTCMDNLQRVSDFDMILFDTSPSMHVADTYLLAATINANVIMVVRHALTDQGNAAKAKEQFISIGCNISGVILNRA